MELLDWIQSEEGKISLTEYCDEMNRQKSIRKQQLERLHANGGFVPIMEKVIAKYESEAYVDRWMRRSIHPPEDLYDFFMEYAEIYGRECNEEEMGQYGNMFTEALFFCDGYYFNLMHGQGSVVVVTKCRGASDKPEQCWHPISYVDDDNFQRCQTCEQIID